MPSTSNLPSSFASAAAGQNPNREARGGRSDGRGAVGGEWSSRRDGRSANGTLTFRRSSTTPLSQTSNPPSATDNAVQPPAVEPPSAQPTVYEVGPSRYTKDDLLDMYRGGQHSHEDPSRLFISGWDPSTPNGNSTRTWGKSSENVVPQDPGTCWDWNGDVAPLGLEGYSTEEKEAFQSDINSPLKPPQQNKEGHQGHQGHQAHQGHQGHQGHQAHQGTVNGRKLSVSHGTANIFGANSPSSATRPSTRRRETIDSNPFSAATLASPTTSRLSRDDSTFWPPRKSGDLKESETDEPPENESRDASKLPIGGLLRSNTSGTIGMSSMWPSAPAPSTGGFGNFALPASPAIGDKRGGGSRLAHLMPKENPEGGSKGAAEGGQNASNQSSWRTRPRTDTDPFGEDELSGSAVLGGAQDTAPGSSQPISRVGTLGTPVKGSASDFGMSGLNLGEDGPVSPSETNPYRSPPVERHEQDAGDSSNPLDKAPGAVPHESHSNFGTISRGFPGTFEGSDRSQTSSVGNKNFPLGGLSSSGWPAPSTATPDRERTGYGIPFGGSLFTPMNDMQSPGLTNLNVFGPSNNGSIGRGSKLGSLFPPAMQAQMQSHDHDNGLSDALGDIRQSNPLGAIGRGNFNVPLRDADSPMRSNRGVFEELFPSSDNTRSHGVFGTSESGQPSVAATAAPSFTPISSGLAFSGGQPGAEPPSAQVRQMVMPDRMRWVYLDPQGQIQGPFTGLEMNDWYKANFFTPDLRVKKLEDSEFEPLGQLIRRIGNSREPFLVPQIGIAHGPPIQTGPFGTSNGNGVVPPLSGVFPTFGRTLTAEEQNNLERRKQEEQFIMAQQRDFMMRHQAMAKFQMGPNLQHHSSVHSLQSQPSFGNMASPIGGPQQQHHQHQVPSQQQPIGPMAPVGVFDAHGGLGAGPRAGMGNGELFRPDELASLSATERQMLASLQDGPGNNDSMPQQPIGAPGDGGLYGLPGTEDLHEDEEGFKGRLQEFEDLRANFGAEQATETEVAEAAGKAPGPEEMVEAPALPVELAPAVAKPTRASKKKSSATEDITLSLTQQVQKTQASSAVAAQDIEPGMPMPFPPPASTTPLPAPLAQRAKSNLPEQFNRSQSGTPDATQPPPMAPWAKEPGHEGQKGPSLKEIQEAEARKAARAEEAAAALRKAAMEQEVALLREKEKSAAAAAAAAQAGLPATSTWGQSSPVPSSTPWTKPGATKAKAAPSAGVGAVGSKKTLADIQREEEARKQKAKDLAVQSGAPASNTKSYAILAGKQGLAPTPATSSPVPSTGSGWATVGAGGKVKAPIAPAAQTPVRAVSSNNVKPPMANLMKAAPKPVISTAAVRVEASSNTAMDEFNKWANRELSRCITGVNDITSFQADLAMLPLDIGLIADAVYAHSTTINGRHFAEEYVRRKKLAEKGVVEKQPPAESKASGSSDGWSEVAKKSGNVAAQNRDNEGASMQGAGFKVIPGRKKGKK